MLCPRCPSGTELVEGVGVLGEPVCPACHGRLLLEAEAAALLFEQREVTRDTIAIAPRVEEPCPACAMRLSIVDVEGTHLLFCTGCGSAWLDAGTLAILSEGRVDEVRAPPRARGSSAVAVVSRGVVDLDQVVHAFARADFRTAADARLIGRGHGLLVDRAPRADAERLAAALAHHGIEAELVDAATMALPPIVAARTVTLAPEGFTLADGAFVPYADVVVAALGIVHVAKTRRGARKPSYGFSAQAGRFVANRFQHQTARLEVSHDDELLLDVVHGKTRLRMTQTSIARPDNVTPETAFRSLTRDLLSRLPASTHLAGDARLLLASPLARMQRYGPREWEHLVSWGRWRVLHPRRP